MFHDIEKMSPNLIVNHLQIGLPQLCNTNFLESTGSLQKLKPLIEVQKKIIIIAPVFVLNDLAQGANVNRFTR